MKLDCRGMACPKPVLETKSLLEEKAPESVQVLVDNGAARDNVSRFLGSQGYTVNASAQGADFLIEGQRDPNAPVAEAAPAESFTCSPEDMRMLVFIRSQYLGHGDDVLGGGLMKNFLATLKEVGPSLWRIMLVNSAVKLAIGGSESLETLKELADSGVSILVCGTCLNHFGLLEQKEVGETTNMLDIVTSLQVAGKVVTV